MAPGTEPEPEAGTVGAFLKGPKIEKIQDRPPGLKFSSEIENFKRAAHQTPNKQKTHKHFSNGPCGTIGQNGDFTVELDRKRPVCPRDRSQFVPREGSCLSQGRFLIVPDTVPPKMFMFIGFFLFRDMGYRSDSIAVSRDMGPLKVGELSELIASLSMIDDRQITHLICVRLKHLLYDFFRGCFGPFI